MLFLYLFMHAIVGEFLQFLFPSLSLELANDNEVFEEVIIRTIMESDAFWCKIKILDKLL